LKGGGFDVTLASVRTARINETVNILNLKSSIIDLVSSVITSYRTYLQAREQLEIARQSLQRAKELVGINRELIAAGRMAEVEIVQTEADVANREFNVLSAENSADSARLALVKLLDVDKRIIIIPTEKISTKAVTFDINELKRTAFANRNDYLSALLKVDVSKMDLMTAQNNKLWDLSLVGGYDGSYGTRTSMDDSRTNSWNLGLKLTIPFRDLTLEQNYLNARIALEKDEANLAKLRETIEIDVQDALREVDMKYRQVILAQQARVLSGKKLDIEREKMKSGRSTNFQLVSYENDLVNALNGELSAGINYQNAMAVLDRTLGTTLDRWGIMVSDKRGTQP
jgi:outer membrane protein TolC